MCFFSFLEKKPSCFDEESDVFIEVECFNVDPVLGPAPDGLTEHQVLSHKHTTYTIKFFSNAKQIVHDMCMFVCECVCR